MRPMFQTHCYDSWLGGQARQSRFLMYSQLGGTFPAPLFLFLAGISFALVTEKLIQKGLAPGQIARSTIRRGAEILGFGLLFRLQEYVVSWGWAPKSDLLRVDILNTIGLSMMLMGLLCWAVLALLGDLREPSAFSAVHDVSLPQSPLRKSAEDAESLRKPLVLAATLTALLISFTTPLLWTTWRPRFLPWPLESYINGVHNLGTPQAWLFPLFPWETTLAAFRSIVVDIVVHSFSFESLFSPFFLRRTFTTSAVSPPVETALPNTTVALAIHAGHITPPTSRVQPGPSGAGECDSNPGSRRSDTDPESHRTPCDET